jgi:hypothetical protein
MSWQAAYEVSGVRLLLFALLALWALEIVVPLAFIAAAYATRRARRIARA